MEEMTLRAEAELVKRLADVIMAHCPGPQARHAARLMSRAAAPYTADTVEGIIALCLEQRRCTAKEIAVALRALHGRTTSEIAGERGLSPETVNKHLDHIFMKCGVHSRVELAALFLFGGAA